MLLWQTGSGMSSIDAIIELYKKDVDRTLLRENLKLTPEHRLVKLQNTVRAMETLREAGKRARAEREG